MCCKPDVGTGSTLCMNPSRWGAYTLLDVETRVACAAHGLDPDFGILHVDARLRESFIYDLAVVDVLALEFVNSKGLRPYMFRELRDRVVRLDPDLTRSLAESLMPRMRKPIMAEAAVFAAELGRIRVPYRMVRVSPVRNARYGKGRTPPTHPGICEYCQKPVPKKGLKSPLYTWLTGPGERAMNSMAERVEAKRPFWERNPCGLMSLLKMLKAYASIWCELGVRLDSMPITFTYPPPSGTPNHSKTLLYHLIDQLELNCAEIGLVDALARVRELRSRTQPQFPDIPEATVTEIVSSIQEIRKSVLHELEAHKFLYVTPIHAALYESQRPFGEKVGDRFPLAGTDIEESSKCLALGRDTACAFHLMRVAEHGLKAVAGVLGIPKQRDWGAYIKEINGVIHAKPKLKGVKWPRDTSFYEDVTGDILGIKLAWRNPGIHIEREYKAEEAAEVFAGVKVLMERIALKLPGPKAFK